MVHRNFQWTLDVLLVEGCYGEEKGGGRGSGWDFWSPQEEAPHLCPLPVYLISMKSLNTAVFRSSGDEHLHHLSICCPFILQRSLTWWFQALRLVAAPTEGKLCRCVSQGERSTMPHTVHEAKDTKMIPSPSFPTHFWESKSTKENIMVPDIGTFPFLGALSTFKHRDCGGRQRWRLAGRSFVDGDKISGQHHGRHTSWKSPTCFL